VQKSKPKGYRKGKPIKSKFIPAPGSSERLGNQIPGTPRCAVWKWILK
jgi:hypothetical protein